MHLFFPRKYHPETPYCSITTTVPAGTNKTEITGTSYPVDTKCEGSCANLETTEVVMDSNNNNPNFYFTEVVMDPVCVLKDDQAVWEYKGMV